MQQPFQLGVERSLSGLYLEDVKSCQPVTVGTVNRVVVTVQRSFAAGLAIWFECARASSLLF